jgi:exopolyphosphatase
MQKTYHFLLLLCLLFGGISMPTLRPIKSFIQGGISRIKLDNIAISSNGITIAVGNEAADADSIISSLTYAYLKSWQFSNSPQSDFNYLKFPVIPVVAINRSEINLRRDVELLLKEVDLQLSDLLCIDDCDFKKIAADDNLDLILVDHNIIANGIASLSDSHISVKEILDHHKDEGKYLTAKIREIAFDNDNNKALVASTCTLIGEKFLENIGALNEDIATLLIAVIALDSLNMDPAAMRGTPRDLKVLNSLQSLYPNVRKDYLYDTMKNAKTDPLFWESLSAKDAIRLDFKEFQFEYDNNINEEISNTKNQGSFGIASVLQPLDLFVVKNDLNDELDGYFNSDKSSTIPDDSLDFDLRCKDMLVIMGLTVEPKLNRELIFYSHSKNRIQQLNLYVETTGGHIKLSILTAIPSVIHLEGGDVYVLAYNQGNIEMSRKQIAPLLSDFYSSLL